MGRGGKREGAGRKKGSRDKRSLEQPEQRQRYEPVQTPLERTTVSRISGKKLGVVAVLRAGLGMLDAVIKPLNVAAKYVDRISKGDIPSKITEAYNGDFNEIKNNLNICIDALNGLLNATAEMNQAQKAGDIEAFIAVEQFQGAYTQMAKEVNEASRLHINNILKLLEVIGAYSEGDFSMVLEKPYTVEKKMSPKPTAA